MNVDTEIERKEWQLVIAARDARIAALEAGLGKLAQLHHDNAETPHAGKFHDCERFACKDARALLRRRNTMDDHPQEEIMAAAETYRNTSAAYEGCPDHAMAMDRLRLTVALALAEARADGWDDAMEWAEHFDEDDRYHRDSIIALREQLEEHMHTRSEG